MLAPRKTPCRLGAPGLLRGTVWLASCALFVSMSLPPSRALVGGVAGQRVSRAWNFAYGSNLDELTRRRRQLRPSQIQPAVAHGWELRFSLPGIPFLEPAFASLRPSRSNSISTHGVCLELGMEGWFRLLTSEGVLGAAEVNELRMRQASLEEVLDRAAKKDQDVRGYRLLPIEVQPSLATPYRALTHPER